MSKSGGSWELEEELTRGGCRPRPPSRSRAPPRQRQYNSSTDRSSPSRPCSAQGRCQQWRRRAGQLPKRPQRRRREKPSGDGCPAKTALRISRQHPSQRSGASPALDAEAAAGAQGASRTAATATRTRNRGRMSPEEGGRSSHRRRRGLLPSGFKSDQLRPPPPASPCPATPPTARRQQQRRREGQSAPRRRGRRRDLPARNDKRGSEGSSSRRAQQTFERRRS